MDWSADEAVLRRVLAALRSAEAQEGPGGPGVSHGPEIGPRAGG
ncbi:hypothetical protein [Kitasatospora sp. NPDC093806]